MKRSYNGCLITLKIFKGGILDGILFRGMAPDDMSRIKPLQGFSSGGGRWPPVAPAVIHIKPLSWFFS